MKMLCMYVCTLGLASGWKGPSVEAVESFVEGGTRVFADVTVNVGLLKLFWRETRALLAEQSSGV